VTRLRDVLLCPLEDHLPGLAVELEAVPLVELESPGNKAIGLFKERGGAGLLVPEDYGGAGLSARQAVAVQRGLGFLSPSTAVGTTMHLFTTATLVEIVKTGGSMEWMVIEAIARQHLLVASGFAEGDPNGKVLRPTMRLRRQGVGYRLDGEKVPCSLAESMDLITVSAVVPEEDGTEQFAVGLIPASSHGLKVLPYWQSPVLGGAETRAVRFDDVPLSRATLSYVGDSDHLDAVQVRGYVWFECLITAAYLGVAAALVERVLAGGRTRAGRTTELASELELAFAGLDSCAGRLDAGESGPGLLAATLLVRYGVERAIERATDAAFEVVGVAGLAGSADAALLLAASRAVAFHPPSRVRAEEALHGYLLGADLVLEPNEPVAEPNHLTEVP